MYHGWRQVSLIIMHPKWYTMQMNEQEPGETKCTLIQPDKKKKS